MSKDLKPFDLERTLYQNERDNHHATKEELASVKADLAQRDAVIAEVSRLAKLFLDEKYNPMAIATKLVTVINDARAAKGGKT